MKNTILLLFVILCALKANAQVGYSISVAQQNYKPLTTGTNANTGLWDGDSYTIPIGFDFKLDGKTTNTLYLLGGTAIISDTQNVASLFLITDMSLHDRGNATGNGSESPIRYQLTGTAPNRILKCEVYNAGMYEEYDLYNTNNDFVSYQIWLYETSNMLEVHYGPSKVSYPIDYFPLTGQPIVGYFRNFEVQTSAFDKFYSLQGKYDTPILDSTDDVANIGGGLLSYPKDGTVYRFAPKTLSVSNVVAHDNWVSMGTNVIRNNIVLNNKSSKPVRYNIVAANGASVNLSGMIATGKSQVDVSALPPGMYVVYVQGDRKRKIWKVVKL